MLFYRAALPLSAQTLTYAAGVIRRHRRIIGSYWRKLNPARQALLVLAYLRKGETFTISDGPPVTVPVVHRLRSDFVGSRLPNQPWPSDGRVGRFAPSCARR